MLDKKSIIDLNNSFQRIFSLNITRSTYREIQNALKNHVKGEPPYADKVLLSLLKGKIEPKVIDKNLKGNFDELIQKYSPLIQIAKDVYEKGEFVNFITSDTLNRGGSITFFNRIRRIDGAEFDFATDSSTTTQLLNHFFRKVQEIPAIEGTSQYTKNLIENLSQLQKDIESFLKSLPKKD